MQYTVVREVAKFALPCKKGTFSRPCQLARNFDSGTRSAIFGTPKKVIRRSFGDRIIFKFGTPP